MSRTTFATIGVLMTIAVSAFDMSDPDKELRLKAADLRLELRRVNAGAEDVLREEKRNNEACYAFAKHRRLDEVQKKYSAAPDLKWYDADQRLSRDIQNAKDAVHHDGEDLVIERLQKERLLSCNFEPNELFMIKRVAQFLGLLDRTGKLTNVDSDPYAKIVQNAYLRQVKLEMKVILAELGKDASGKVNSAWEALFDRLMIEATSLWGLTVEEVLG